MSFDSSSILSNEIKENLIYNLGLISMIIVERDTIKFGDSFGEILAARNLGYPKIYKIVENIKDFDVRWLTVGKAFTILLKRFIKYSKIFYLSA